MRRRALVAFLSVATVSGLVALTARLDGWFRWTRGSATPGGLVGDRRQELVVYTYDGFVAKGGLGPEIFPLFEKRCDCRVRALPVGDGQQILARLQLDFERGTPVAQVVIGLDQPAFNRARPWLKRWGGWRPSAWRRIRREVRPDGAGEDGGSDGGGDGDKDGFLPYDYGFFAFMADTRHLARQAGTSAGALSGMPPPAFPRSFRDLLGPSWKRGLLLEDPRTSTPGLAFVLYADAIQTRALTGESAAKKTPDLRAFWRGFRGQWLTLAPGWDQAYGLFLGEQAPLVWSYTTSQAYHEEHGDLTHRYRAVLFDEGQPIQVEGAALIRGSESVLARRFLDFLLSREVQERIPLHSWMYPVREATTLPASFEHLPYPKKVIHLPSDPATIAAALRRWSGGVEGG